MEKKAVPTIPLLYSRQWEPPKRNGTGAQLALLELMGAIAEDASFVTQLLRTAQAMWGEKEIWFLDLFFFFLGFLWGFLPG